jgi:alpha-beta hydrolase superfamily lysophospholipase
MTTTCTQHEWTAPDGERFSYSIWGGALPTGDEPRAVIIAVHGLSGAALDYEPLGSHMARHGAMTYALELRGQGNDPLPQRRGDLESLQDWYADLSAFFSFVRSRHSAALFYYYGESMGAALLTRFLAQAKPDEQPLGLVLASPVVEIRHKPTWWQDLVFRFMYWSAKLHRINVGKYTKRTNDDHSNWVTRDLAHRDWFATAPHRVTHFTVRFFACLRELIEGCFDAAPQVTVPVLVIYAGHDVYITADRVEAFFEQLGSKEKKLTLFPESYHLLLHDYDRDAALARIEEWLLGRIEVDRRG